MTTIYIDTEFNEFRGSLISMALVAETGEEWYECLYCPLPGGWVKEHVIPKLNKRHTCIESLQISLQSFLGQFESVNIVADWPEDIQHFCWSLITGPGYRINTPPLTMEVRRDLDSGESAIPHNALEDARAIKNMAEKAV